MNGRVTHLPHPVQMRCSTSKLLGTIITVTLNATQALRASVSLATDSNAAAVVVVKKV